MDTVTIEEQVAMGLRTPARNFVPVATQRRSMPPAPINAQVVHTIDAQPNATQHIELRTSAVDRALGFAIATAPLAALFSVVVMAICALGFGVPLVGLPMLVIVATVFAVVWTIAYLYTLSISAEGVSLYEAQEKWGILREEQRRRWEQWEGMIRDNE